MSQHKQKIKPNRYLLLLFFLYFYQNIYIYILIRSRLHCTESICSKKQYTICAHAYDTMTKKETEKTMIFSSKNADIVDRSCAAAWRYHFNAWRILRGSPSKMDGFDSTATRRRLGVEE